jgi:hypothetical protein
MPEAELIQLGAIAIIFLVAIREFFAYLKSRKDGNNGVMLNGKILEELQLMNTNHLETIRRCIESGNTELRDTLHDDFMKVIEILGRIDGRLGR